MKKDLNVFNIESIIDKGREIGIDGETSMVIALWIVSNQGNEKIVKIDVGNNKIFEIEIQPSFLFLFDKLMKNRKNKAFYFALNKSMFFKKEQREEK